MIKKLLAAAATALLSLNASAAYIQYNFSGPLSGYIIQNVKDQSIADFRFDLAYNPADSSFRAGLTPQLSEGQTAITSATTYFVNGGPDNFRIYSDFGDDQTTSLSIDFASASLTNLAFTGKYTYSPYTYSGYQTYSGLLAGVVTVGTVDPVLAQYLDSNGGHYDNMLLAVIPTLISRSDVPEPASLALLGLGMLGMRAVRRRKA